MSGGYGGDGAPASIGAQVVARQCGGSGGPALPDPVAMARKLLRALAAGPAGPPYLTRRRRRAGLQFNSPVFFYRKFLRWGVGSNLPVKKAFRL